MLPVLIANAFCLPMLYALRGGLVGRAHVLTCVGFATPGIRGDAPVGIHRPMIKGSENVPSATDADNGRCKRDWSGRRESNPRL